MIALVSAAMVSAVAFPTSATCGPGYFVEGVRHDGVTRCLEQAPPHVCNTRMGCSSEWQPRSVPLRIYCTAPTRPVVVTARRIKCR